MTDFSISLGQDQFDYEGELVALGSLKIGEFRESFHASLSYWGRDRYLTQWREALERLIKGAPRSALVTSMHSPATTNLIRWWPLYRIGDNAHFQEQVLFMNQLEQPFEEADLYRLVPPRETTSEDSERLSEWALNLTAIETFLESETPRIS
ncbi:hypothetical protein [Pelagibius sp.]|uniref:hypothetical protein n=1 Tax=Pelagibius sp. TaxID=1931238 RepID=UPI003BB20AA5